MPTPDDPSPGLPVSGSKAEDTPDGGQGKAMRSLTALMDGISACRADILRRETVVADLQRRLQGELQPLRDAMLEVRVDTFRVLGRHLASGTLNRRAHKDLELALYDLANELEAEFGVDLRADRSRIFPMRARTKATADPGKGTARTGKTETARIRAPDPARIRRV